MRRSSGFHWAPTTQALLIGRAYVQGLGANGQAGVENVLDLLRSGIDACLLGLGHSSISALSPDDLVIPRDSPAASAADTVTQAPHSR